MMLRDIDYDVLVGEDPVTGEYVGIVREFPSLSYVAGVSRQHAAEGIRALLRDILTDIYSTGEEPPAPAGHLRELASA